MKRVWGSVCLMGLLTSQCFALNCEPVYKGKAFVSAVIYSVGSVANGPAECTYDSQGGSKMIAYRLYEHYVPVSENWRLVIPGIRICSTYDGNTFADCQFALRNTHASHTK